jgi:hypothetical protein
VDTRHIFDWEYPSGDHLLTEAHHVTMGSINVEFDTLADGIASFKEALTEFPEFGDSGHWPLAYLESDLKVRFNKTQILTSI